MGQRHQLFVIARIKGKYRSLAAVHHQWLYGSTALKRCRDILGIFSRPSNRIPLAEELKEAGSRGPEFWERSGDDEDPRPTEDFVPFPFITSCLVLGSFFGPEDGYLHWVDVLDFGLAYNEGDNNNGITIIDISDLDRPRYCFVDFYGMESDREVQLMAPLSARTYLEAYYDLTDPKYNPLESCIEKLEPWPMVTTEALEDTWPGQGWEEPNLSKVEDFSSSSIIASREDQLQNVRPLRDSVFDQVIDALIEDADVSLDHVIGAQRMHDFWRKLRARFCEKACGKTFDERSLDLLCRSLEGERDVDLTPFDSMKSGQIVSLIDRLLEGSSQVRSLNLSGLQLSQEDMEHTLRKKGSLNALYIFGDSPVQAKEIAKCKPDFDVYQTHLLRRPLVEDERFYGMQAVTSELLDFRSSPQPVVRIAWLGLQDDFLSDRDSYDATGQLKFENMERCRKKSQYMCLEKKARPICSQCPLLDAPLPLPRLVGGLKVFLQWLATTDTLPPSSRADLDQVLAASLAIGKLDDGVLEPGVGAMSPELYQNRRRQILTGSPPRPGEWAFLIIQSYAYMGGSSLETDEKLSKAHSIMTEISRGNTFDPKKIHYALVSAGEDPGSYKVVDIPQYLELVGTRDAEELRSWWKTCVEGLPYINYFDGSDVQAIAREVFRPVG